MEEKEKAPYEAPNMSEFVYCKDKEKPLNVQCFSELAESICANVKQIPFPSEKTRVRVPIVISELAKCTNKLRFNGDKVWYYNGIFWAEVTEWELGIFLRNFSQVLGWNAEYHSNIESLLKQFKCDLYGTMQKNRDVVAFSNGILEINSLTLREHRQQDYLSTFIPYAYNPDASCPKWLACLAEWLPEEEDRILAQEVASIGLARVHTEKLPYLYGCGCNGKSVFLEIITKAYGNSNICNYPLKEVLDRNGNCLAMMRGYLLNISAENGQKVEESPQFKAYVSGEAMKCRELYKNPITTDDYPPSIIAANNLPATDDFSEGYFRRLLFIPFVKTIPKEKVNPALAKEIAEKELPGVMNWIIEGARRLRQQGRFTSTRKSVQMAEDYRKDSDSIFQFVEENNNKTGKERLSIVYGEFRQWAAENGFKAPNVKNFADRLRKIGLMVKKSTGNITYVWWPDNDLPE